MVSIDTQKDDYDESGLEEAMNDMNDILLRDDESYCITYFYGDGGAPVYIKRISGDVDAKRAAVYCQFMCEEWFGPEKMLTNLGIASLLITFYGFQHHHGGPYEKIDMYSDRAALCGEEYYKLLSDKTLHREKLREYMEPHVIPDNDLDTAASKKNDELEEATITQSADGLNVCCIYHLYDVGNQRIYLASGKSSVRARDAALFLQFKAEQIFGESAWLSNQGIADLMCRFYGFHLCDPTDGAETIDMYSDREFATTSSIYGPLMADPTLQRDGLQEQMRDYILPSNNDHIFNSDDSGLEETMTVDIFQHELAPHDSAEVYCIEHFYDMGDQRIYIKRASGDIDAKCAAMYCQFKCEEWFGPEKMLTNLGIASLLITFYGYQHSSVSPSTTIDMHADRNAFCGDNYTPLVSDASLHRDRLYEFMAPHVIG